MKLKELGTELGKVPGTVYSHARAFHFMAQSQALTLVARALIRGYKGPAGMSATQLEAVRKAAFRLIALDQENIARGLYPIEVLRPESAFEHWRRFPRLLVDSLKIGARRTQGRTTEFTEDAQEWLDEVPRYYRRNFHFQSDGYLSKKSAELYEHQVEILFSGMADPMRRLIIAPMKAHFGNSDGKGLTFLEVGAGTARASKFVSLAFPKAKIVATDLSPTYLRVGQKRLADFSRIDFLQGDAARLPFKKAKFDAVFSVFLFHELPLTEREAVLKETFRVAKPGAFVGLVDSLQTGDSPEFDSFLDQFPISFHEPYYRNYIQHPMQDLLAAAGLNDIQSGTGFFSKIVSARKAV